LLYIANTGLFPRQILFSTSFNGVSRGGIDFGKKLGNEEKDLGEERLAIIGEAFFYAS
jgi:hypothetical protein